MASSQAQDDVEQATRTHSSDNPRRPPRAAFLNQLRDSFRDSMNHITTEKYIVLSFMDLQLKRIGTLQDDLIRISQESEPAANEVDRTLRAYAQALRDYETLTLNAIPTIPIGARSVGSMGSDGKESRSPNSKEFRDPVAKLAAKILPILEELWGIFGLLGYQFELPVRIFIHILSQQVSHKQGPSVLVNQALKGKQVGFRELDQQGRLQRAETQAFIQRIFMGLFGGISMICPVLIMVLYPSQNTSLITVTLATIIFAFLLASVATDGTGKDVLATTAAYTAVLVVFLGTSGGSM